MSKKFEFTHRNITMLLVACLLGFMSVSSYASLSPGKGSFVWEDKTGASDPDKPLKVYYYRPAELTAETPVWIIMHGMGRNADDYRDYFVAMGKDQGAMIIAPKFTKKDWPKSRSHNLGNISISDSDHTPRPEQEWSFSKIEPLFDYLVDVLEPTLEVKNYFMFGHSAGGQFVHRFLSWKPQARIKLAISANAGWYTMAQYNDPSYCYNWPYSLGDTPDFNANTPQIDPFPEAGLETFLGKKMVVLLGDEDTLRTSNLRQTTQADAQGQHRFERGNFFFAAGQSEAAARGVDFGLV
jgi:pimeloyl-ACP methyl ester carboxylesterase